jgi:hypothetical protein
VGVPSTRVMRLMLIVDCRFLILDFEWRIEV